MREENVYLGYLITLEKNRKYPFGLEDYPHPYILVVVIFAYERVFKMISYLVGARQNSVT